ncbi:hypothetical protein Tco_0853288 [Tanacetum coccineum]
MRVYSYIGSPRADDYEYLELPWMPEDSYVEAALQAPPSLDYVPGPEEPEQAPPSPDYVPGPEHADDEIVAEDQPYAEDASPTAQSPDYVPKSDPEADPESMGGTHEDTRRHPWRDEEEEEHLAPADSVVVALPATDQAPSAEETEPFETDESAATPPPHPAYRVTARISIPALVPTPVWSDAEVARLLAISTPPSSPLSPWSSPLPQIPSPSLPLSPPSPMLSPAPPPSPIRSLGYRAAMIRMRAEAASTSHSLLLPPPFILSPTRPDAPSLGIPPPLPISVPTSSPPLLLPFTSCREDRPESSSAAAARLAGGLRADYSFVASMDREIRRDLEREVGYGITDSQDTDEIYTRLDDEQSQRQLLAGRFNMLFKDRRAHAYTRHQMETYARLSQEAWRRHAVISEMLKADQRRSAEMRELRTTDQTRQQQLIQTLIVMLKWHQNEPQGQHRSQQPQPQQQPPPPTATTTTSVTNTQLQAMIDQGVTAALATRDANRNGDDSHTSGTGGRRTERVAQECTYQDFMKCKPLFSKALRELLN